MAPNGKAEPLGSQIGDATAPSRREPAKRDPEGTRARILEAAVAEFAESGLSGARVDRIALRARTNKRLLYHYYGNKEALYSAALERTYAKIRAEEQALSLGDLEPMEAMRRLVSFTFIYFLENPSFLRMLNNENLQDARYLKTLHSIRSLHSPLVQQIRDILRRGEETGVFRHGIDPVDLYISIAALGYFYFSNIHTLSTIFDADLGSAAAVQRRERHVLDVILGFLRP